MKQLILPTSSNAVEAQVMPRNCSPYCADTLEPSPWALISATNSKAITVAMMDAMLILKAPSYMTPAVSGCVNSPRDLMTYHHEPKLK